MQIFILKQNEDIVHLLHDRKLQQLLATFLFKNLVSSLAESVSISTIPIGFCQILQNL
jgi:hypothetical protein